MDFGKYNAPPNKSLHLANRYAVSSK